MKDKQLGKETHIMASWRLELRDNLGREEGTEVIHGTYALAYSEAESWLAEMLTLDTYQREMLIINIETDECMYQGTFDMVPTGKEATPMTETQKNVQVLRETCKQVLSSETPVTDSQWVAYCKVDYAIETSGSDMCTLENKLYALLSYARNHDTVTLAARDIYLSAYQIFEGN
jgi:hypothetical protein